eukprot:15403-Rhodomonas_salina.2
MSVDDEHGRMKQGKRMQGMEGQGVVVHKGEGEREITRAFSCSTTSRLCGRLMCWFLFSQLRQDNPAAGRWPTTCQNSRLIPCVQPLNSQAHRTFWQRDAHCTVDDADGCNNHHHGCDLIPVHHGNLVLLLPEHASCDSGLFRSSQKKTHAKPASLTTNRSYHHCSNFLLHRSPSKPGHSCDLCSPGPESSHRQPAGA